MDIIQKALLKGVKKTNLENQTWKAFGEKVAGKTLFLFGGTKGVEYFVKKYGKKYRMESILDNDSSKQGKILKIFEETSLMCASPDILNTYKKEEVVVLITSTNYYDEIILQLKGMGISHIYVLVIMESKKIGVRMMHCCCVVQDGLRRFGHLVKKTWKRWLKNLKNWFFGGIGKLHWMSILWHGVWQKWKLSVAKKQKNGKRVLLVTLPDNFNLGNRLQNYALQTTLTKLDCNVVNAVCIKKKEDVIAYIRKLYLVKFGLEKDDFTIKRDTRIRKFYKFTRKYIVNRQVVRLNTIHKEDWTTYDYAITGSDQVWHNWWHEKGELEYYYLQFIDANKRISYAPSFGFSEYPEEDVEIHKKGLSQIKHLSIREKEGAELIEKLVGKKAEIVLDPVFLLEKSEWRTIEKKPQYEINSPYMLVYFLGERTGEYRVMIEKVACERNLLVVDIFEADKTEYFYTTPDEFVWLIDNAEFVCTDSFHGVAFSTVFNKEFLVFKRNNTGKMFGRIDNLLSILKIENRVYSNNNKLKNEKIDYTLVNEILLAERRKSIQYLRSAMNMEE